MTDSTCPMYCIGTVHPAFALRGNEAWLAVIEKDLERAFRIAKTGWHYDPEIVIGVPHAGQTFDGTIVKLQAFFEGLDLRPEAQPIALDTETDGIDQYKCGLRVVAVSQVGTLRGAGVAVDKSVWGSDAYNWVCSWLRHIAAGPNPKLFHNAAFDIPILRRHGFPCAGQILDTIPAHHTVESDLPHELGFVAQRWLDVDPWKRAFHAEQKRAGRKWSNAEWKPLVYYSGRDALECGRLWPVLLKEICENVPNGPAILAWQLWLVSLAIQMGDAGMPLDEEKRQQLSSALHERKDKAVEIIRSTLDWPEFMPRKPAHRKELLYTRLELPVRKFTAKRGAPSTSFKAVVEHAGIPAVRALIEHDECAALLSNVVDKYAMVQGGRLHVTWNVAGTDGSRMSSSPNLQNLPTYPVNVRNMFVAPPGRTLVGADYDQLEYRILAVFAGAKKLLEIFRSGADPHSYMAEAVFSNAFKNAEPKTRKALRALAKRVVYGMAYGAGAETVFRVLIEDKRLDIEVRSMLTQKLVSTVMATFFKVNPEVLTWRDGVVDEINTTGMITFPPLWRTRRFLSIPVPPQKCFNTSIQCAGHDALMLAMHKVAAGIPNNARLLLDGHDSLVVECDKVDADRVCQLIDLAMPIDLDGPAGPVRLTAKASVAESWGTL